LIEDVHEPVEQYKTFFKAAHARNTSEFFEDLLRQSGVDEQENIKTVKELRGLEQQLSSKNSTRKLWAFLRGMLIAALVICLIYVYFKYSWPWLLAPVLLFSLALYKVSKLISGISAGLQELEQQRDARHKEACQQMEPLNRLFEWDHTAKLVQKTVPRLMLDPYFSNARLDELRNTFGWSDQFNDGRSIVFAHSGVLNGNPFVLARTLDHWMGTRRYNGSLEISWTEQERDHNGKRRTVTRHQTLHASVDAAFPEYGNRTFVIYGNEAASDLSFSRSPSDLSKLEDGLISNWKKRRAVKQLEVKSREIGKNKGFTVMSNREFDALFGATDRDHEVQFRLLFTPLAQQEMLNLLKDKEVGYGDDFEFEKTRMINIVEPGHMMTTDIGAEPAKFQSIELARARKFFNDYHNDFFKSFYFGIAPILAIPIYQQHRSHADIYKDVYASRSCFWEHEGIANHFGEKTFQHPECVTRSVLKTQSTAHADGTQTINVTAYGYKGVNRVAHVSVRGDDGHDHKVPVNWTEYIAVQRDSGMVVRERAPSLENASTATVSDKEGSEWKTVFQRHGVEPHNTILRRSVFSAVLG
jgi:hypothetical protein